MLRLFSPRLVRTEEKYVILPILMLLFLTPLQAERNGRIHRPRRTLHTPESNRKGEERLHVGDTDVTLIEVDEEEEQSELEEVA
jgi:hypothetical protein